MLCLTVDSIEYVERRALIEALEREQKYINLIKGIAKATHMEPIMNIELEKIVGHVV